MEKSTAYFSSKSEEGVVQEWNLRSEGHLVLKILYVRSVCVLMALIREGTVLISETTSVAPPEI